MERPARGGGRAALLAAQGEQGWRPEAGAQSMAKKGKGDASAGKPFQVTAKPPKKVLLNPFSWLLWLLDFLIYFFCCCCCCCSCFKALIGKFTKVSSTNPNDSDSDDEDNTRRRRKKVYWEDGLMERPFEDEGSRGPKTVWEIAERSFIEYDDQACLGTREYLYEDDQKRRVFGETTWETYGEVGENARDFGVGLRLLGLQPLPANVSLEATNGPHTMLLYEDTCAMWLTALVGAHSQSIVVATSYATLGIQAVRDAIQECSVAVVVCNRKNVKEVAKNASQTLKTIIYTNHYALPKDRGIAPAVGGGGVRVISFDDVLRLGHSSRGEIPTTPPSPSTLAVIMYTSGSTGKPKGVMITHANVTASVGGLAVILPLKDGMETYIAYLPAAHIFEFCAEIAMLSIGAEIGYADPKTITSKGAVRLTSDGEIHDQAGYPEPPGGIQEFQPTLMVAVPVVWDTLKKAVEEEVGKKSGVVQWLFQVGYTAMWNARKTGRRCPLFEVLIFRKFHQMIGGRLRFGISGGGPISEDVQGFISTAFGFPLIQGYALTETTCAGTCQSVTDTDAGNTGGPLPSVELKLRNCDGPEDPADRDGYKYLATDEDHLGDPCHGRGEVMIRGPSVSLGYFKQPDKTREVFSKDGWFSTGDIAVWDKKGRLKIVDRLKNLVKLKGGEYIAVEHMEKEYSTSPFVRSGVSGGVMCYGDGDMRRPVALVQVNVQELVKWAPSAGLPVEDVDALCKRPEARAQVLKSLTDCAKGKLANNEGLVAVGLISGQGSQDQAEPNSPWTPENGCRTASNKLERKAIQKACEALMAELKKEAA